MQSDPAKSLLRAKVTWITLDAIPKDCLEKLSSFPIKSRTDAISLGLTIFFTPLSTEILVDQSTVESIEKVDKLILGFCEVTKRSLYLGGEAGLGQTGFYITASLMEILFRLKIDLSIEVFDL